ncbi:MAG: DNA pilot protein [Microvirus sp.]|nr:MAG: DNA pilot protein [Microvirus sp.]
MSIWKKIGKVLKKVALPAAGIAGAALGVPYIASLFGGAGDAQATPAANSGQSAESYPVATGGDVAGRPLGTDPAPLPSSALDTALKFLPAASTAIGGITGYLGQKQTNAANAQQAQKQMDFQASQTGTSYQRGVADMQAAGLNPMLAYSQGGAGSGAGASAQMGNSASAGVSTALDVARNIADLGKVKADTALSQANAEETLSRIPVNRQTVNSGQASEDLSRASYNQVHANIRSIEQEIEYKAESNPIQVATQRFKQYEADYVQQQAKNLIPETAARAEFWKAAEQAAKAASPAVRQAIQMLSPGASPTKFDFVDDFKLNYLGKFNSWRAENARRNATKGN